MYNEKIRNTGVFLWTKDPNPDPGDPKRPNPTLSYSLLFGCCGGADRVNTVGICCEFRPGKPVLYTVSPVGENISSSFIFVEYIRLHSTLLENKENMICMVLFINGT